MMRDANPRTIYLKDYTVPEFLIEQIDLTFYLDDQLTRVESILKIQRNPQCTQTNPALVLQGENLTLLEIRLDGRTLAIDEYYLTTEDLTLQSVPQDRAFELRIHNQIHPALNTALEGLYLSKSMLCTQCEAEGFRKITYFMDRPDVMSRFTTRLIADQRKYPVLLSNGNKTGSGELDNNQHWVSWEDPFKKPCYLFALVAGDLQCVADTFTTMTGRQIDLEFYVEAHDADKCDHAMQSLKNAMAWDERVYGREYDLDLYMVVAVGHFNMGAMENKGLNVFNTKFVLARPDTATDSDYEHIEGVIGHEYFHNWSGNRVTCRDWFQLSLKEGFTVFRDQQFTADQTSAAVKRIEDVKMLRNRQFAEDAGPLAHPVRPDAYIEINNFYTLTVYEKGAEIVRMLHTLLGAEGFRKGSDLYFDRHDGQAVTCDDFVKAMEDSNAVDLTLFRRWYAQAGTPVVHLESNYDAETGTLDLILKQSCPATPGQTHKDPVLIPVKLGLLNPDGSAATIHLNGEAASDETILQFTAEEQVFTFSGLSKRPVLSVLRDFSAPVILKQQQSLEELAFLLSHDSNPFNRWEAGQKLSTQVILGLVDDIQQQRDLQINPLLIQAYEPILQDSWDDLSYFALLLELPDENTLAGEMKIIDVDAIHQARSFVQLQLAQHLQSQLADLYTQYHRDEAGCFDAGAIGRRRLKNSCLHYLIKLENKETYGLARQQFDDAGTMTEQMAALAAIVNSQHPDKAKCLDQFYRQWEDEALVIDKWFTLQATSDAEDAFETVSGLLEHPAFEMTNPNRVRSLIGAFSQSNPLHFHAPDGRGYRFLTEQVIALNTINPQVASRMVGALTQWRRYDSNRQQLMQSALEQIIAVPNLSKDVFEIASKSLS